MWTSSRSKRALFFALALAPALVAAPALAAIDSIVITHSGNGTFTAGVTTNTPTTTIFINTFDSVAVSSRPPIGEVVTLELLDGSGVVPNALTPNSFTTTGTGIINGGNSPLPITFFRAGAGTIRIRATSQVNGVVAQSPAFTVNAGAANKLIVIGPGQTHFPGTDPSVTSGVTGSFTPQEANQPFSVTVRLTDVAFNQVAQNDSVSFSASDTFVDFPAGSLPLGADGFENFNITITAARVDRTLTVTDDTNGSITPGTLNMTTAGPNEKEIFPFPSPFNPRQQNITFRFRLSSPSGAELTVTDVFGQKIWTRSVAGVQGFNDVTWDGRNDNGTVIAAGVYYAVLEIDGSVESKKRFGVVK